MSLVADLDTLAGSPSDPTGCTAFGNALYFTAAGGDATSTTGLELFKVTQAAGGAATVALVADIQAGFERSAPQGFTAFASSLYFSAFRADVGTKLFRVNAAGTVELVADIDPGLASGAPLGFTAWEGALYFQASGATGGEELWKLTEAADGAATVSLVADILAGGFGSLPTGLTPFLPTDTLIG